MQASTGPYEHSGAYPTKRGHLSISDESHHVTETIGYMYDDDYDRRDSRHLSYIPSSMNESLSVTLARRDNPTSPDSARHPQPLPIRTSSIDRAGANGQRPPTTPESGANDRDGGGQLSPVLTRSSSARTSKSIPINDIDYESDPAAVAQELSNLAALRRMSMDVGAADPDLPSFGSNFGVPPMPSSTPSDDDDTSRLFWVPARLHPGLAPKEFKSFLDGKADQIKRRSGELTMTDTGPQRQGSTGGLRRKKSMLSRQIDTSSSGSRQEGADLGAVMEEAGKDAIVDDKPILPPAPPGHSLRRSTRTTYRRGSVRTGERISSRRIQRQSDVDAETVARRSPPISEEPPILGLTRVSTEPTLGSGASLFSRPAMRTKPTSPTESLSSPPSDSDNSSSANRASAPSQSQPWQSQSSTNRRPASLETPTATQKIPPAIETPSEVKESSKPITSTPQPHIPTRKSSHDPPPSQPPQTPLPAEPTSRSSKRAGIIRPAKESPQTISEIAANPAALPGNSTRTDSLSFIPTISDSSTKRSDSKKSKDKKDGEGGRKSSWNWLRGTEEKEKDKKKEEDAKKTKSKLPKITEKTHDNTRLDVLQKSIDGAQRGRESVVIDRAEVKLEDERRKDNARKSTGMESKKEKESGLFSSFFGGKKKSGHDSGHKKHSSRNLSPEPRIRELKPDIDYNWTRFPIQMEREIYRTAHYKLANPKRALHSQVLLSNFMYSYLAKVQQMHPNLSLATAPSQTQQRTKEQPQQSEEYSQYQRYQQNQEHDQYNNGSYNDSQMYDYDSNDREGNQWSQSRGHGQSTQNGSAYGQNQYHQHAGSRSQFSDDAADDDDDMW
ncbi:hypothetical protein FQN55_006939 [Onygenales sp. PD_40]|nr:hypothetical protein FQN55_006939 [Onygenales sp. PD_40]